MSNLGKRLIKAAKSAQLIAKGEADPKTYKVHVPANLDVRAIRARRPLRHFAIDVTRLGTSFRQELGAVLSDAEFARAIAQIRELGWYAKIQPEKDGIVSSAAKYESLDVPVLIDHMARPEPAHGRQDPNLRKMLELLARGNFWVMLSLGEKTSKAGPPWDDVIPIARSYIEAAPDRCVWASDWPHPVSVVQPPNDADLLELLYRYAPDDAELQKILVANPAKLFGFGT